MSEVVYLYGFVPEGASPPDFGGLEERPVETLAMNGFHAAVSRLPADVYGEGQVEERMRDLSWVARRGVEHERVVTWFADRSTIVPARLLTLFSSEDALSAEAAQSRERIADGMRRFAGAREWDLKISYDARELGERLGQLSEEVADLDRRIAEAGEGRRYLLERKREERVRAECATAARRLARDLFEELSELADDAVEMAIPTAGKELPVVLNGALLVSSEARPRLEERAAAAAAELHELGVRADLTGPWAPYRFVGGVGADD